MISPLNTIISNRTGAQRRYRFTRFTITLGTVEGATSFRCNGDVFTMIENNQEAEQLLCDYRLGLIDIRYEIDDTFVALPKDNVAPISGRAQLTLNRHAEEGNGRNSYERTKLVIIEAGTTKPIKGARVQFENQKPIATDENGYIDTYVTKLPSGHYNITITADGYEKKEIMISLPIPPLQVIDLAKGHDLSIRLVDSAGKGVENATVYFEGYGAKATDAGGLANFKNLPTSVSSTPDESSLEFKLRPGQKESSASSGELTYYVYKPGFVPVKGFTAKGGYLQFKMMTPEERSSWESSGAAAAAASEDLGEDPVVLVEDVATDTATEPENVAETVSRATKARESDPAYKGMFEASVMEAPKTEEKTPTDTVKYEPGQAPKVGKISSIDDLPVQMFGMEGKANAKVPRSLEEMPTVEFGSDEGMKNAIKGVKDLPVIEVGEKNGPTTKAKANKSKTIKVK